jgi:hypothetical protein
MSMYCDSTQQFLQATNNSITALYYNGVATCQTTTSALGGWQADNDYNGAAGYERVLTESDVHRGLPTGVYNYLAGIGGGDPGTGSVAFDSFTPASITEIYIDDVSEPGHNQEWLYGQMAVGDVLIFGSEVDTADYVSFTIDSVTDSTGFWTIGVTYVDGGTIFSSGNEVRMTWSPLSQAAGGIGDMLLGTDQTITAEHNYTHANVAPAAGSMLTTDMLYLDGKEAIDGADAWLRLNNNGDFASGTFLNKQLRIDFTTAIDFRDTTGTRTMVMGVDINDLNFNGGSNVRNVEWSAFTGVFDFGANFTSIDCNDTDLNRPVIEDYGVKHTAPTVSTNAVTVDCTNGNSFKIDMEPATAAVTLTLSNPPASGTYGEVTLHIEMGTPAYDITWPGSVTWFAGGSAPTLTTVLNGIDTVHLYTIDGGTNWYGTYALRDAAAAVTNLNSLSDVIITAAATGDILRYNGSNWVDYPDSNYAASGHTHSAFDRASSVLSGANVFSNIVVTDGITTAVATRAMSINDLGGPYTNNAGTVTAVNNGNGMNFTNITTSGTVTLGTPGSITDTSTNSVTTSSHTHAVSHTGTGNFVMAAGPTLTGTTTVATLEMADNILRRPYIDDYALFRTTLTATATTTLNYSTAQVYAITMNANITTLSVSNEPASGRYGEMTLKLIYNSATARTIDWTDIGVKWGEPGAPTLTSVSGKHDVVHLWTDDAGASWYGSYILNY